MQRRAVLTLPGVMVGASMVEAARASAPIVRPRGSCLTTRDGVSLHYADWGRGKPVVFVHSWAMAGGMWDYQVAAFSAAGLRCIVYDRRGHGRSDVPSWGYDYNTLADDLAAVIDGLDLHEVTLIGHSMGAGEIVRYLRRHGASRIERIVLLAPTTPGVAQSTHNPGGLDPEIFARMRATWQQDFPNWMDENTDAFFTPQTTPGMKRWLTQMMLHTPLQVMLITNRTIVETDFRAELPRVRTPLLIVQGDQDKSAPLALTGQETAALVLGSQLEVIEGAPHGLFVTHREAVNARVLKFLQT